MNRYVELISDDIYYLKRIRNAIDNALEGLRKGHPTMIKFKDYYPLCDILDALNNVINAYEGVEDGK